MESECILHSCKWYKHRETYRENYGEFDEKLHVLHKCDNPYCINPEHLFLGTMSENMKDM